MFPHQEPAGRAGCIFTERVVWTPTSCVFRRGCEDAAGPLGLPTPLELQSWEEITPGWTVSIGTFSGDSDPFYVSLELAETSRFPHFSISLPHASLQRRDSKHSLQLQAANVCSMAALHQGPRICH